RIRQIFRWGASEELCSYRVYRRLRTIPGLAIGEEGVREKPAVSDVDTATVEATLKHLPPVVGDMVQLQLLTGARPDEICALRPSEIDRTRKVWRYRPAQHKNKHRGLDRVVFIGRKGQKILRPYLDRPADSYCFSPAEGEQGRLTELHERRKTPLNHGNRPGTNRRTKPKRKPGARYTTASLRRAIHRACEKAQITPWSPNRLRHAAATKAREIGGLDASQAILGHQHAKMSETYAHLNLQKAEEVIRQIG
ncbi:MAG: site-specific integrase, partial [Planctomycetota bacterium]|nr:site-specific integrase [Planctomycetota bacterium]